RAIAHRVAMRKLACQHIADDFHVAMRVGAEAAAGGHPVFIDDPQHPELDLFRIEVLGEREAVAAVEPAMVAVAPVCALADFLHDTLLVDPGRRGSVHDGIYSADRKAQYLPLIYRIS